MGYYIDLSQVAIDDYADKLKSSYLVPSRRLLLNNIEMHFNTIKSQNIGNVEQLRNALKTKKKLGEFAAKSNISVEYLTILVREINSSLPRPNKIQDFPEVSTEDVARLEEAGIKNTLHLYEKIRTPEARESLGEETEIASETILRLAKLTDLSRVRWVNHTFAFMLFETGFDTLEKLAKAEPEVLHKALQELNLKRKFFKGNIGLNDIKICIQAANDVPQEVEF